MQFFPCFLLLSYLSCEIGFLQASRWPFGSITSEKTANTLLRLKIPTSPMLSRFTCVWSHSRRSVFSCDRTPSLTCQSWCEYVLHTQFTSRQSNFECGYKEKPCIVRFFFVTTLKIQAVRGFDLNSPRNGYLNWKGGEKTWERERTKQRGNKESLMIAYLLAEIFSFFKCSF